MSNYITDDINIYSDDCDREGSDKLNSNEQEMCTVKYKNFFLLLENRFFKEIRVDLCISAHEFSKVSKLSQQSFCVMRFFFVLPLISSHSRV